MMPQRLTTMPALVESPFIIVRIGKYEFGSYQSNKTAYSNFGSYYTIYPNYMESIDISKINGEVNSYTISMKYQISRGDDPNFLEKVFSSISRNRKITISYGDWASTSYIYREESAIVTNIKSSASIRSSSITYTLYCISDALPVLSTRFNMPPKKAKGSTIINDLLRTSIYGFTEAFKGMLSVINPPYRKDLIASNDKEIELQGKTNVTPWEYAQYVVDSMRADDNSTYYLSVDGDNNSEYGGPVFKVSQVTKNTTAITSSNTFEVDVNFPGDEFVTDFSVNNDQAWTLLYEYTDNNEGNQKYTYNLTLDGKIEIESANNLTITNKYLKSTDEAQAWWNRVTEFPISATLTLKGLTRPAILMTYVKVNVYFYGAKSIYSGWYIITEQKDRIDSSGYRSTLSLTRVAADTSISLTGTTS